ncbi:MAG: hypothetical protein UT08_C0007G0008 [Candidatus Woesebacteria bacterium GW2011_GWB1_38_8]|uniref:Uncharacterized protein n=1 Tax=Candidatus Woesebacteria bacterium GW2011_GWB1_38_8 TaxID=1618570 RepID=A0A0G0LBU6_9BACT|nr:MAG: hypothetical protein UT08_C0007G0008 [Candidatus Woesebacteria bacterium GW2011_GWB1_38_8]
MERKYYTIEQNGIRHAESQMIYGFSNLIASTRAAVVMYLGVPVERCLTLRDEIRSSYESASRKARVGLVSQTESLCRDLAETLHPHYRESSIAYHTRRLDVIQRIVVNEIAVGKLAVDTADLIMGAYSFDLDNLSVVKEQATKV